jgi:phage terminase small subunit
LGQAVTDAHKHAPRGLTPRQARFVAEYLVDLNATQAAIRAGYSAKTAQEQSSRLLSNAMVAAAVAEKQSAQLARVDLTAEMVKERLRLIGFQDVRKLFDEAGNLLPLHKLSDDAAVMVAGLEVIKKNAQAGDGIIDTVHKVKVVDPIKALEMLAKHYGLLTEKVEHSGGVSITWLSNES